MASQAAIATPALPRRWVINSLALVALAIVAGLLVWQGLASHGDPHPEKEAMSPTAAVVDTGILVFREGLEAILVLAALTAGISRKKRDYWKPVAFGAGLSFCATVVTWFIAVGIISSLANNVPALHIQAATGLLAIVVLLVIMNWFFHRIYWTGWITHHNRRKQAVMGDPNRSSSAVFSGLAIIGFTSVYREGFEVVLFLQDLRLTVGSHIVLIGVAIGLALTAFVGFLTFVAQYRLPYKKMLVFTGIMLGCVLLVMVGEQVSEMQAANWIPSHDIGISMPDWLNTWFGIFPTWESLGSQVFAGGLVIGSYYLARRSCTRKHTGVQGAAETVCILPDCGQCDVAIQDASSQQPVQISVGTTGK